MPNRLASETSLYLKQHANNPVDWFPWGPEALAKAKELDRPIFLSIGYSACHWCHVMEHESFENAATAAVMNEHFVCIKVDREERPDIDTIYMNALQVLTREGGGWPLSVFLTPDLTPFFAGTYYPPDDRYAPQRPSFRRLLAGVHDAWVNRRDHVKEVGKNVTEYLKGMSDLKASDTALSPELLSNALNMLRRSFDSTHGGFGSAPKFPHALELKLLLRLANRFNDKTALHMVRHTLTQMARGGMYDQLGGGFSRYSVDAKWLVPHFEKMLYDNALLVTAYVEAWQVTRDPFYKQIAEETLEYVYSDMQAGGFFSAEDADSEGEEGKFYVWSEKEVRELLGDELGDFAVKVWGVTPHGNFEGHNILFRARNDEQDAAHLGLSVDTFREKLTEAKRKLILVRSKRVRPGRDEKILTAWNGLMISAFAKAGAAFGLAKYVNRGRNAADFILATMRSPDGRLFRSGSADGTAKLKGYLEDYAFLADALVSVYEATFEAKYLKAAGELADVMLKHFADPNGPGFFFVADDHEKLITRTKDVHDGSTPSGNAVAVTVLLRLAKLLDRRDFAAKAEETLRGYRETMTEHPAAAGQMLIALDFHLGPTTEVAVIGVGNADETLQALDAIRTAFRPRQVLAFDDPHSDSGDVSPPLAKDFIPLLKGKPMVDGKVTAYVCENFACQAPLVGVEAIEREFTMTR
ncbi:MAG: thioredoxin domain-containing protein [Planctomycetes bacterium]|nr:thioredoxin domain-containing protein [Planctomycetota bacterium]